MQCLPKSQLLPSGAGGTRDSTERAHIWAQGAGELVLTCWGQDKHNGKEKRLPREGSAAPYVKLEALEGFRIFLFLMPQ